MKRGDVWLVTLDPTRGGEIQKTRPCIIVSPNELIEHLRTVIVVPMTSGSRSAPFRVALRFRGKSGFILPEQVRTVDKSRLVKRLGAANSEAVAATLHVLREMFGD